MTKFYLLVCTSKVRWCLVMAGLLSYWLLAGVAQAQTPAWVLATSGSTSTQLSNSSVLDMALDSNGNLVITGSFIGQLHLGTFTLTSSGYSDWFVAKYVPATNTWAWAMRGGGSQDDTPGAIVVSGQNIYVVGTINNTLADAAGVTFDSTNSGPGSVAQAGAGNVLPGYDIALLKLVDQGSAATVGWTQVAGGNSYDHGYGVAASGTSVYITGTLSNSTTNSQNAVFGGSGTLPGTNVQYGVSGLGNNPDLVVAKYTDQGSSALFRWAQVGGNEGSDQGTSVAVSGSSVYVTGYVTATNYPAGYAHFGGTGTSLGTLALAGVTAAYSTDLLLAKYNDLGGSATVGWVQVAGGTDADLGQRVVVSGSQVYVTGQLTNSRTDANQVRFGGTGTTVGTHLQAGASPYSSADLLLAKYVDQGTTATVAWTQIGGGSGSDAGYGLLVSNSHVYVSGGIENNAANGYGVVFGGSGTTPGTLPAPGVATSGSFDLVVASYLDAGTTSQVSWQQVGGGPVSDFGCQLVLVGTRLYVAGQTSTPASYGSLTVSTPPRSYTCLMAALDISSFLPTTPAAAAPTPRLYPNPAPGPATLNGAVPGTTIHVLDALGRRVATATADATGTATLPAGLAPGLYLVRAGASTVRWAVE